MAHGLEGRTPLLDPSSPISSVQASRWAEDRRAQGQIFCADGSEQALPAADPFSEKRGFTVPVAEWIRPRAHHLAPLLAKSAGLSEICHPEKVGTLFRAFDDRGGRHEGIACWQLLFYALWHAIHVERRAATGDVFATLEAK